MKIICDRASLLEATGKVQGAAQSSTVAALEGILFTAENGYLTMTGYNLEMGITTAIEAKIEISGGIVLSARYFSEIIKKLPGDKVTIESDERFICTIVSGNSKFSVIGMSPEEYPELPSVTEGQSFSIPGNILCSMIRQTRFSVSKTDDKPMYTGILFDVSGGEITLVALDGYRMAIRREKISSEDDFYFIVPEKTLSEILKLIGENDNDIKISVEKRHIIFEIDQYVVISRLIEGRFMDIKTTIPPTSSTTVKANTRDLIDCIDRVSLVINDRARVYISCIIDAEEKCLRASCESTIGNSDDRVSVEVEGNRIEIGFNSRYILDALRAVEDDMVKIELNSAVSPVKIVPVEGDSFIFLVQPVRVNK